MDLSTADQARVDLAAAFRLAARFDLHEGIDNHFSIALDDGTFLINRWGVHWSRMTAGDILQVDCDGAIRRGHGTIERTALAIHSQVHLACPHAVAILHTHMTYTTTLACANGRIEPISQNSLRFRGRVAYDDGYRGIANDSDEGARLAAALGKHSILLMPHHGVLVTGRTIGLAFDDLYFLERTARVQILARASGYAPSPISNEVADLAVRQIRQLDADRQTHFEVLKGLLENETRSWSSFERDQEASARDATE
jgi:ribulose-5-phosphate 4-epimerase/fuculose-1-phosphate aldolase